MATISAAYLNHDLKPNAGAEPDADIDYIFSFEALAARFDLQDKPAGRARDWNRRSGFVAVGLVLAALGVASFDLLPKLGHAEPVAWLGGVAAAMGILGTGLGVWGITPWSERRRWLRHRLQTEMLRLFHFHYIAANLREILAAGDDARLRRAYCDRREQAFEALWKTTLEHPDEELEKIVKREGETDLTEFVPMTPIEDGNYTPLADRIFMEWRIRRLDWQLGYAASKLDKHSTPASPRRWAGIFFVLGWFCVGLIVLLHVAHFLDIAAWLPKGWLGLLVIWVALFALAGRALEEGLRPHSEVERYEGYRANIRAASDRFDAIALDAGQGLAAKLGIARGFERTSMEEMRVFLRTHWEAKFLL